eukprot:CAMPEP_0198252932 /NCGR_PEP_ID=MMETSP1447-20131203/3406_1 /TAXON_ID=420782 /ORGANISM="Chaetoceros dichaeta, Strain CCMP1751" /LENGTH=159 /DNA_ID=CAMNT_0043938375 /DNA_START=262 /DNA_END=741 /DNA_ORIENTATION=-
MERQCAASSNRSNNNNTAAADSALAAKDKKQQLAIVAKKQANAMAMATSPGKSIMMNGFMMYMSGSSLNMWSLNVTGMSILTPIKSILGMNFAFKKFEDPDGKVDMQMAKVLFALLNLIWLGVGLYKMSKMRLLPTTSADWSGSIYWKEMVEVSSIPPL